ncbi:LysR family transcriptional regulator [Novosphingobium sp. PP1Y]|uniref:LysR family transcriptional regulator n=1 Tax=Novosphingobium sp. PP1Y TaxID=702113 RepID=UPI00020EF373|nr:LysR substrate-binding domain-containing protein [Novosphingobium sp. PP1Y]CCA94022.1 LysR family transcriptional regulator [Novosphingobium sp. PP1Y]
MLDHAWLRSFLAVARVRNFTHAAANLGLRQPTVSEHVRKLETEFDVRLFLRDTHSVALTRDGEAMVGFANSILETCERAQRHFRQTDIGGSITVGVTEDVALAGLPELLRGFRAEHPRVSLELTVGLSEILRGRFERCELDMIVIKRRKADTQGEPIWLERLCWVAAADFRLPVDEPLPLILLSQPAITRDLALAALERAQMSWRVVCTSDSQSGVHAALEAGLGIAPHARSLIPTGLRELRDPDLPLLAEVEFAIFAGSKSKRYPGNALYDAITRKGPSIFAP